MKKRSIYTLIICHSLLSATPQSVVIDKMTTYLAKPSQKAPTLEEYKSLGVQSVTARNIAEVDRNIAYINSKPTDTKRYPYRYQTSRDYIYNFDNTKAKVYPLKISNGIVDVSNLNINNNSTLFLKLKVEADTLGYYFEPTIKTSSNGKSTTHTLEANAKGIRYLNISSLSPKDTIELESKFLTIDDQDAQIIMFENENLSDKKIMVIAPHPDDAEIAAFGLYSSHPKNSYIVTVTAGEAGGDRLYKYIFTPKSRQYLEKGYRRVLDSITVPNLADVPFEHCINLGFFDGTLDRLYRNKDAIVEGRYTHITNINTFRRKNISSLAKGLGGVANWNSLVDNLAHLITKIKPDIIVSPYPLIDSHPDHKFSTIAVVEAINKIGYNNAKLYLYTNHFIASEYYPYGNEHEPVTVPPNYAKPYIFDSIYSYPLNQYTQGKKILALDSMSDLILDGKWSNLNNICQGKSRFLCKDLSYFRRAIRSNELFFVIENSKLHQKDIKKILGITNK